MKRSLAIVIALLSAQLLGATAAMADEGADAGGAESPGQLRQRAVQMFRDGNRAEAMELLKQARTAYEEALAQYPEDYEVTRNLAMTLFDLGEYETAREVFTRALTLREGGRQSPPHAEPTATASTAPDQPPATTTAAPTATNPPPDIVSAARSEAPSSLPIPSAIRGLEIDPQVLLDPDPAVTASNVSLFVTRAAETGANVVYIHGLADPRPDGSYANAYFDTVIASMEADILRPVAEQLHARDIALHVVMPALSLALPDTDGNRSMMVMSMGLDRIAPSASWRKRLSPFNTNGLALMTQLYEDLATNVPVDGIVFGDDAYLTDAEDLNPAAIEEYTKALGIEEFALDALTGDQKEIVTDLKVKQLDSWCTALKAAVQKHRPDALFSRTLYAAAIHHPPSKAWLAQDYEDALNEYEMVYALADPEMEDLNWGTSWLVALVERVVSTPSGRGKTVFRIATYSQKHARWHSERSLARSVSRMSRAGAVHFVLGPNDPVVDRPRVKTVRKVFQAAP